MSQQRLILVDTTGIQPYVFGSNRLRENVGASYLVAQATGTWARAATQSINGALELYAGGGNYAVLLPEDQANEFTRILSRHTLQEAPGLNLVVAQRDFDDAKQALAEELQATFRLMAQRKQERIPSVPLLGMGVTRACASTGLPAANLAQIYDELGHIAEEYPASLNILAKLNVLDAADDRLRQVVPPHAGFIYPHDFQKLGATFGDQSFIAVVHADGDGIGQRLLAMSRETEYITPDENGSYTAANAAFRTRLRIFSEAIEESGRAALRTMVADLKITYDDERKPQVAHPKRPDMVVRLRGNYLPLRPLVFGGDDVTFVCDGRLGLALAIQYVRAFEAETQKRAAELGGAATACAGIAIVKSHYPFARAYDLAEDLCKSAKQYKKQESLSGSCLDWHFAFGGLFGGVADIRRREYTAKKLKVNRNEGHLELRPVTLDENPNHQERAWPKVECKLGVFQTDSNWVGKRSKVKELRDVLREGPKSVKRFVVKYEISDAASDATGISTKYGSGWPGEEEHCAVFDAIELADFYIPLQ